MWAWVDHNSIRAKRQVKRLRQNVPRLPADRYHGELERGINEARVHRIRVDFIHARREFYRRARESVRSLDTAQALQRSAESGAELAEFRVNGVDGNFDGGGRVRRARSDGADGPRRRICDAPPITAV
jgi:hypothetical protein